MIIRTSSYITSVHLRQRWKVSRSNSNGWISCLEAKFSMRVDVKGLTFFQFHAVDLQQPNLMTSINNHLYRVQFRWAGWKLVGASIFANFSCWRVWKCETCAWDKDTARSSHSNPHCLRDEFVRLCSPHEKFSDITARQCGEREPRFCAHYRLSRSSVQVCTDIYMLGEPGNQIWVPLFYFIFSLSLCPAWERESIRLILWWSWRVVGDRRQSNTPRLPSASSCRLSYFCLIWFWFLFGEEKRGVVSEPRIRTYRQFISISYITPYVGLAGDVRVCV
jgi:hypothetical protein